MPLINFKNILSCSSEDRVHCSENLLKPEQYKKWLSSKGTDERITCILELEKSSFISSVDIGNDGSAFIELFVSKSDDWTVLLPTTILMTPKESRSNTNRNQVKLLKSYELNKTSLNEKWDRLKIVCYQKFNRSYQFGLSFIKLHSSSDAINKSLDDIEQNDEDETSKEQSKIGSFFAKKQAEKKLQTPPDQKRFSTNVAEELLAKRSEDIQNNDKAQIMKNVVFVLSGFQNPLRSELRNKATSMGAVYNDDWDDKCTHLICAFPNTPKFTQVQQTGKGFIVNKQWILDCYKQAKLISEKSYELKGANDNQTKKETPKRTSKNKKDDEEGSTVPKDTKRKTPNKKKSITVDANDNNESKNKKKLGELPDFFHEKHFYVSYGDYDDNTLLDITRVILAYDGILERQITSDVQYVITNRTWNQDFEKISKSNPEINFLNLDWLQDCHNGNQFVPIQPYLTVP